MGGSQPRINSGPGLGDEGYRVSRPPGHLFLASIFLPQTTHAPPPRGPERHQSSSAFHYHKAQQLPHCQDNPVTLPSALVKDAQTTKSQMSDAQRGLYLSSSAGFKLLGTRCQKWQDPDAHAQYSLRPASDVSSCPPAVPPLRSSVAA